jgi:hypothetical protein
MRSSAPGPIHLNPPARRIGSLPNSRFACLTLTPPGVSALLGLLCIVGGVLVVLLFRRLVDGLISAELPLRPGSAVTEAWLHPPVRPLLQVGGRWW